WNPVAKGRTAVTLLLASAGLALGACGGDAADEPVVTDQPQRYEGLSPAEIQSQAEPMTQEEAERLGIVDTTIGVGAPMNPDSVVPPAGAPVVPGDAGGR